MFQPDRHFLLVAVGTVVHLALTYSVIDIHFQTPVVRGIEPVGFRGAPAAKRVFLIVADGLRADKLFEFDGDGKPRAPYLYDRGTRAGRYGISHTRPPTESRPGHVALCAGFFEDPSALFSGWKVNPVQFDSIFNRTSSSWGFGAPDVVPIFEGHGTYAFDAYPEEMEDFAADYLGALDTWVFDKVDVFMKDVATNASHPFRNGPSVMFLHLLGLDSNGHAHGGPSSSQYLENIALVDEGIRNLTAQVEELFPDSSTAYVFTADHGMTDQASHGDGAPENTETPLVVWGAGIGRADSKTAEWGYGGERRCDIEQSQVAPLMASVLGIPTPVNSLFALPKELLDDDQSTFRAHAVWNSAKQLESAYAKKAEVVRDTSLTFKPFGPFVDVGEKLNQNIEAAFAEENMQLAEELSVQLGELAVHGLDYLQRYDWVLLMVVVTLGFGGWMAYLVVTLIQENLAQQNRVQCSNYGWRIAGGTLLGMCWTTLAYINAPATYYIYFALPCIFIFETLHQLSSAWSAIKTVETLPAGVLLGGSMAVVLCLLAISIGFVRREILFFLTAFSSALSGRQPLHRSLGHCLSCMAAGSFALIPAGAKFNSPALVATAGLVGSLQAIWVLGKRTTQSYVLITQLCLIVSMGIGVLLPTYRTSLPGFSAGLYFGGTLLEWTFRTVFIGAMLLPLLAPQDATLRIQSVFLGILTSFMVTGVSWEPLFLCALGMALWSWYNSDMPVSSTGKISVGLGDVPDALRFLIFANLGFFGQGNIASVASFDIASVYRLTHIFNPFVMGGILFIKILIPLMLVASVYTAILKRKGVSFFGVHALVVLLCDVMSIRFFFLVKGVGSWQEIGTSLGFYGVMNAQVIVVLVLFGLARVFVGGVIWKSQKEKIG
ncbi:hypothetical protein BSKO_00831 [Bryopsis sp. KO-2023]|nr:hypothetical protein BSKO_00831 [Bryopsis sp. KO-2023]